MIRCTAVLFAALAVLVGSAQAQTPVIEEIVVTAQKREQDLQDTPVSVTAFTGAMIDELGIRQSVDITAHTPNFSVGYPNGDTGIPALFLRGVGLSDFRVFTPSGIAPYADDVYIAQSAAQIFQLMDLERVEVLRGPQGTLYGRNATGGAINYISRKPTEEWDGWVRGAGGEYGYRKFEGAIGGPISDNFGFRVAALNSKSDGWMKNRVTGNDQQGIDETAGRLLLQWDATDSFSALLNVHGGETKSDAVQYRHRGVLDSDGNPCEVAAIKAGSCFDAFGYTENAPYPIDENTVLPAVPGFTEGNYDVEAKNDTQFWGTSLRLDWDINDTTAFTSITAYDDLDDSRPEETDASPNDVIAGVLGVEQQTFTQEFRIGQQREGWNWIAGAFYLSDEANDRTGFSILGLLRPVFDGATDPDVCADGTGISPSAPNTAGFCPGQFVFTSGSRTRQDVESVSVYGDASVGVGDAVTLNFGLRYTDEQVDHDVLEIYDEPEQDFPVRLDDSASESFNRVSGRFIVDWRANDNVMVYGGISTGFKAGGIDSTADGIVPFDSEDLISYEAGFKTMLAGGSVRFNGALFFYDYSDLQVFTFVTVGAQTFSVLSNAADADIKGGELELQWLPVENLLVNLGLGYLDSEYKDFIDPITGDDFSGNRIIMSPEWTLNGLVQYAIPLGGSGDVTLQVDWNYQDDTFFDAQNNPLLSEDGYWLFNARVGWTSPSGAWDVSAWGRNLANEQYMVYAFDLSVLGFNEEMLGVPRMYGLEATFRL